MGIILIPLFIIIAIVTLSTGGDFLRAINIDLPSLTTTQERPTTNTPQAQAPSQGSSTAPATPGFILDTTITEGPEDGSVIADSNTVTFEFSGTISPEDRVRITYETYIAGIDTYWRPTSSTKRTIKLPTGPTQYTFQVRAKYKQERDYTPASRTFSTNTSPYYGKVNITGVRQASSSRELLITLRPSLSTGEEINITGWRVEGELGGFTIPLGIEQIPPTVAFTPSDNIMLRRGDTVSLTGEKSPFGRNVSFRPNICMGYLQQFYTFPLSVPSSCPDKPTEREIRNMRTSCQDFILRDISFSSCTVPDHSNNSKVATDSECISYIENHFNYEACSLLHRDEDNFTRNQWHIYMQTDFTRDKYDTIRLLDKDGRIVDAFLR